MSIQSLKQGTGSGKPTTTPPNGEELFTELIQFLRPFCENESGKSLKSILQGHNALSEEVSDLRTAYSINLRTLTQREKEWDTERSSLQKAVKSEKERLEQSLSDQEAASTKLDTERGTAESLRHQIQDNEQKIKALIAAKKNAEGAASKLRSEKETMQVSMEAMSKKNNELEDKLQQSSKRYDASVKSLNDVQETLTTVQSFLVPLQGLVDAKRTALRDALADLFNIAMDLFQSSLHHDLSDEIIAGSSFKSHAFSLPASNSAAAKQMRVVAGLAVCGRALARHLFRDTFLTNDYELDTQLQLLATADRLHHAYVRAALAKVLPVEQKQVQKSGAEKVISDVMLAVGPWSPDEQALRSGLKRLCDKAIHCWALAQQVEDRVWPDFKFELSEDWQPLPIPRACTTPTANAPNGKKMPNTSQAQNGAPSREPHQVLSSDVVKVVWPTFFAAEPQSPGSADTADQDRLLCGYVLTQAQSQKAEEEISRRAARRTRRTDAAPQKKRRDSGVFLSGSILGGSSGT
ncbi:hypothetical protein PWT90_00483 [Aphanocladium album]|nr:hypothetical protein PWT90_00483 [Aphanocladium album]